MYFKVLIKTGIFVMEIKVIDNVFVKVCKCLFLTSEIFTEKEKGILEVVFSYLENSKTL